MAKTDEIIALLEKCLNTQLAKEDTGNMAAYMDMVATRHELVHQALTKLRAEPKEKPKEAKGITQYIQCPDDDCCGCLVEGEMLGDIRCNECGKSYEIKQVQP